MKIGAVIALIVGFVLAVFLVWHIGVGQVFEAVGKVGWGGFAVICLAGLAVEGCMGTAWYALLAGHGASWIVLVFGRQVRDSSSDLLPFTQIGGMVLGARAASLCGVPAPQAYASMMVDVTTELMGQIAFIVLGLLLGLAKLRASAAMAPYANGMILGTALLIPAAAAFIILQRKGSHLAETLAGRLLPAAVSHTEAFAQALHGFYQQPLRLTVSATCHLISWIMSGVWIWLILKFCGADIGIFAALTIEALLGALRSATVFIPSAIGVQEAGYAMLAPVFGAGAEIGLALSLLKRARDVAVGIPVLLLWQAVEGRHALRNKESA